MKDLEPVFDHATDDPGRRVVFVLSFSGVALELVSWFVPGSPERWPLIQSVSALAGTIEPDEGKADVGSITVKVLDDERFHQVVPLLKRNTRVQLKAGFHGMLEIDFPIVFTGLMQDPLYDGGMWTLTMNDLNYFKINSAFRTFGKSRLNGAVAAGDVVITVDSTDGTATGDSAFHDPATSEVNGWLLIEKEIVPYTGKNATQFTGCTRGALAAAGSLAAAHADNIEVRELFVAQGNPIDLLLKLLTSTGAGTNGAYDDWESDQGLGIPVSLIDVAAIENERDLFVSGDVYRFILKEPIGNVKSWIEAEIMKTMNAYPIMTGEGLISIKVYSFPYAYTPDDLTEEDVLELRSWRRGFDDLINQTEITYDWSPGYGEFLFQRYDVQAESANDHGLSKPWKLEAHGIYSDLQGESLMDRRVTRLFGRYKDGAPTFSARTHLSKFRWDAGDIVNVTLAALMNVKTGVLGVASKFMEVIGMKPNLASGEIAIEIMDTSLGGRGAGIAPNGTPDYASASEYERNYAFICVTATEKMANGDDPYLII